MIISRSVSLPYPSFLTAWLALELGELPTALLPARVPNADGTLAEQTERAWQDLADRELAGTELTEEFAGTLTLLATARTRFYGFFHEGDGDTRSVLVANAKLVATIDGTTVTLQPCHTNSAQAVVDELPKIAKAPGEALSTPASALRTTLLTEVRPTGVAARMRWLLAQPRTGGGQLYAARQDRNGHRRVCDQPLSYVDTATGRILATEHRAADGTSWRSLVPADPALLVRRLTTLLPP